MLQCIGLPLSCKEKGYRTSPLQQLVSRSWHGHKVTPLLSSPLLISWGFVALGCFLLQGIPIGKGRRPIGAEDCWEDHFPNLATWVFGDSALLASHRNSAGWWRRAGGWEMGNMPTSTQSSNTLAKRPFLFQGYLASYCQKRSMLLFLGAPRALRHQGIRNLSSRFSPKAQIDLESSIEQVMLHVI